MVCTDIAARGLDFKYDIDHVINFDFPQSFNEYIHRTGRTARPGQKQYFVLIILSTKNNHSIFASKSLDNLL